MTLINKPRLLLLEDISDKARIKLEEYFNFVNIIKDADIVFTKLKSCNLKDKVVACPCTSVEHIKAKHIIHLDDNWKKNEGLSVTSTAEHAWSLILQLAKMKRMQLKDKVIGIVGGYGRIGSWIDRYAMAFDMRVKIIDLNCNKVNFDFALSECDIITIHVPLNEQTKGMIGKEQFALMKKDAILVNTSRQEIIDIDALMDRFDIYYADDFSYGRDISGNRYRTIQTPHIGGNCYEAREMTDLYIADRMIEFTKETNI